MLVSSSFLSYSATASEPQGISAWTFRRFSITLRRLGKVVASLNAIWILVSCFFQFSNFFNRCYCNSSIFYWGARAFTLIDPSPYDHAYMRKGWTGGVVLASGSVLVYLVFVNLFINPELPE